MSKHLKLILTVAIAAVFIAIPLARASEELASSEGVKCTACHDKPGSKLLTSKGKYFELQRSFDGFDDIMRKYRKCTSCHARTPGNQKLTKRGERLKAKGVTMEHVPTLQEPPEARE